MSRAAGRLTLIILMLGLSAPQALLADDITITTTYPSPRGVYQELRTTNNTFLATLGGNVGIGTTTPAYRLDVVGGDFSVSNASGGYLRTWGQTDLEFDGGPDSVFLFRNNGVAAGRTSIGVGASEFLTVLNTGNVGIGTENPLTALHVRGAVTDPINAPNEAAVLLEDTLAGTDIKRMRIYSAAGRGNIDAPNDSFTGTNGATSIIAMDLSTTYVGLGVAPADAAPATKLHIRGTGVNASALMLEDTDAAANVKRLRLYTDSGKAVLDAPNDAFTGAIGILNLNLADGNIGMPGTYAPGAAVPNGLNGNLDVNDIWIRSLNGGAGGWASQSLVRNAIINALSALFNNMQVRYGPRTSPSVASCDAGWLRVACGYVGNDNPEIQSYTTGGNTCTAAGDSDDWYEAVAFCVDPSLIP